MNEGKVVVEWGHEKERSGQTERTGKREKQERGLWQTGPLKRVTS